MTRRRRKEFLDFRFEGRNEPVAPIGVFRRRMLRSGVIAIVVIGGSLAIGVLGYHYLAGITSWVDCLYNASMILGGMGPVDELHTRTGKIFASAYALYSGVTLLTSVGLLLSPALHRLMHRFHVETESDEEKDEEQEDAAAAKRGSKRKT